MLLDPPLVYNRHFGGSVSFCLAIGALLIRLLLLFALYVVVKNFGRGLKFRGKRIIAVKFDSIDSGAKCMKFFLSFSGASECQ